MTKMSREQAEKMLGKRTPPPAGRGVGALNDLPKPKKATPKDGRTGNPADPLGLKKSMRKREEAAGLKRGGKVMVCKK